MAPKKFITVCKPARYLFLSWAWLNPVHPLASKFRSILILPCYLCLCLQKGLFPWCFPTRITCSFLSSHANLILPGLSTQIMFSEEYNVLSSHGKPTRGGPWPGFGARLTTLHWKKVIVLRTVGPIAPSIRNGSSKFRAGSLAPSSWFDISGTLQYACLRAGALIIYLEHQIT